MPASLFLIIQIIILNFRAVRALTGNLYNEYIKAGDFFKIDLGESTLEIDGAGCSKIEYDYLYY